MNLAGENSLYPPFFVLVNDTIPSDGKRSNAMESNPPAHNVAPQDLSAPGYRLKTGLP